MVVERSFWGSKVDSNVILQLKSFNNAFAKVIAVYKVIRWLFLFLVYSCYDIPLYACFMK